jgi:hypothetical protein
MWRRRAGAYLGFLIIAGFLTSLVGQLLLCLWPAVHSRSLAAAFLTALAYVSAAVLSGLAATWFFWTPSRMSPSSSLILFALTSAVGWIWIPSVVLLSRQGSIVAALLGAMGAALMAIGLGKALTPDAATLRTSSGWKTEGRELFAQSLLAPRREGHGFIIALCIYAGFFALRRHAILAASILLALSTFLLAWKLTLESGGTSENRTSQSHAALRLVREGLTAVLLTTAVVLLGFQSGVGSSAMDAASATDRSYLRRTPQEKGRAQNSASAISGYESIILWPVPEKKKLLAPSPSGTSPQAVHMTKPLVIRFDGPYWYFRPPRRSPGSRAHVVHGTPLGVNIRSTDFVPLLMEARQSLGAAIQLTCCREIQVTIENHDNIPGRIALGILLTDSTSIGKPTLYLDQQPVISTEPDHFSVKSSPVQEVLRFPVPNHPRIDKFDEITVIFFPDTERAKAGAKIAIQEFQLLPR